MWSRLIAAGAVVAAAGFLASTALAAGPPGSFGTVSLGPLPAAGKASLFRITITGTLKAGVKKPTINLELANGSVIAGKLGAGTEGAIAKKGGTTTITFLVAVSNGAVRTVSSARQGDALDMIVFGSSVQWGGGPLVKSGDESCANARAWIQATVRADYSNFWFPNSKPGFDVHQMIIDCIKTHCRG